MNVINLNEVYKKNNALYYWCNCTGDLNIPGYPSATPDVDMLPNIVRAVYDNYWAEGRGAQEYVVTYNGTTGLMLGWLFDYSWLKDLGIVKYGESIPDLARAQFHSAVRKAATALSSGYFFYDSTKPKEHQYPVFYGEDTDPDGDEILLFFPYDELCKISEAYRIVHDAGGKHIAAMSERLYKAVEISLTKSKSAEKDRTYEVTEFCPHCETEVTMTWNTDTDGFKAFCPHCGERLMLCDECKHAGNGDCDYDSATDTCRHNPKTAKENKAV